MESLLNKSILCRDLGDTQGMQEYHHHPEARTL